VYSIISILNSTSWRLRGKQCAAEKLRLKPSTLESKMKKLDIRQQTLMYGI
jgi:transcriptional regulator with GAF, ATPase, and Fis domain